MSGFVAKGNNAYNGMTKAAGTAIANGAFVTPNFANGTSALAADGSAIAWFVANENDSYPEAMIDDVNFTKAVGKLLKIKQLLNGEEVITDQVTGTHVKGAVLSVLTGKLNRVLDCVQSFRVLDVIGRAGKTFYHCIVEGSVTVAKVYAPEASIPTSTVDSGTEVELSCFTPDATIYYTTDGSAPDATDTEYEDPIEITATTTIKAIAIKSGKTNSDVVTFTYTVEED